MTSLVLPRPALPLRLVTPGLALCLALALLAMAGQAVLGIAALSPLVLALILGVVWRNTLGTIAVLQPGIAFSLKRVLRAGVVLLGFQLTLTQAASVGVSGLAVIAVTLVATFTVTKLLGRLLGVPAPLAELIAAGSSICGASAVIAVNTVTNADDEDVAYAIACVTVFGTLAMLGAPMLAAAIDLGPRAYGLWTGASIHEVAQVVGAAFARGEEAGHFGTIAKLSRVMLLAPLILTLGALRRERAEGAARPPLPWFVFGFIAVVLLNTVLPPAPALHAAIAKGTAFLLTVALAAMGLETDIRRLKARGLRPLALGALAAVFISGLAFALVQLVA